MVPGIWIQLERLPLTPNGKLDRKALPEPEYRQSESEAEGYEPPRTPQEKKLAAIWCEVLQLPRVGVHDNFFDLGGHSLLAVRLCARMEEELNVKLPLNLMFRARTIEDISASIAGLNQIAASVRSSIILCRVRGTKAPIFAAPPGIGLEVMLAFRHLADRLEPDQPMYAFAELDPDREWTSLEELAAHYVRDLVEFQPDGPYHLIGWSFGGMIIFEMAHQLLAQNRSVGLVGLLDANNLPPAVRSRRERLRRQKKFVKNVVRTHLERLNQEHLENWPRVLATFARFFADYVSGAGWRELYRLYASILKRKLPRFLREFILRVGPRRFKRAYPNTGEHYTPKPYPGKLVLFWAQGKRGARPLEGWSHLAKEMDVVPVPGDHYTMLDEPDVKVLAEEITKALARSGTNSKFEAPALDTGHALSVDHAPSAAIQTNTPVSK
jgi:thioesterase domain-containing protein/acyl carrier protein